MVTATSVRADTDLGPDMAELEEVLQKLIQLRSHILEREREWEPELAMLPEENRRSAINLVRYLALRETDLRELQEVLSHNGLSSLGRAEARVLSNLEAVIRVLSRVVYGEWPAAPENEPASVRLTHTKKLLRRRTEALFGPPPAGRAVRIMVTMPSEAATSYALVRDLLASGMDCMRINCAHDDAGAWEAMVRNLRHAEEEVGRFCRILMDIPGPKLRTGPLAPGPQVLKVQPLRDELGWVVRPAEVWLTPNEGAEKPSRPADASIPLPAEFLAALQVGDRIRVTDTRGAARSLLIVGIEGHSRWARLKQTTYLATGARVVRMRRKHAGTKRQLEAMIGTLPGQEPVLQLRKGDHLILTRSQTPGRLAVLNAAGLVQQPARIPCTLPEALDRVKRGERIWFDDGKIGGVIKSVQPDEVLVEITSARPTGDRLRADKGINLPDSRLDLPSLSPLDLADLAFIARHADLVGYSFVRSAADVVELQEKLAEVGGAHLGIVLKIETREAFEQLPSMLFAAMRSPSVGIMIARGDLAVECGFARLAEVQEEILWLGEAAHVPVVWATQVLERLAKDGRPSRAEVTDAAMAERAECVMLNKGPFVVDAVRALDSILTRMQGHQEKKRSLLRPLHLAETFFASGGAGNGRAAVPEAARG